jgi:selenide,water dikinase
MAVKAGIAGREQEEAANSCMMSLNAAAADLAREHHAHACTDVTGFGLLGHALQMARAGNVSVEIFFDSVPKLDGVVDYAATGLLSAAAYSNRNYVGDAVSFADDIKLAEQDLLFDPQTSGGLLVCCTPEDAGRLVEDGRKKLTTPCAIVGRVARTAEESRITVERAGGGREGDMGP